MDLLPFGQLPPYSPREFVPASVDWSDWDVIAPIFDRLEADAAGALTAAELEEWILHWSELSAALDEESSRRYIANSCHTDNAEAEKAYLHFVENIHPRVKPRQFALEQLYLKHPQRAHLPERRFEVFNRDVEVSVRLFRDENVPLETEEAKLGQQYQKLSGGLTVTFRGEEKTLPQMAPCLEEPDRGLREEAWRLVAGRRLEESGRFDELFDEQLRLRERIALQAGCRDYIDYTFQSKNRFDYTARDCMDFHGAIEELFMPLLNQLHAKRKKALGLESLRPWDLAVDPANLPRLRPFQDAAELVSRTQAIFDRLDPVAAGGFQTLRRSNLLDLANRKGKAPGGYQATLNEARLPFIFMNAVGLQRDVETMLHEAGHAFHALATREEEIYHYRHAPIEFCEVASMSMELLGNQYLEEFYNEEDATRARRDHLEGIIKFFPWMAAIDAFQHWIYSHPDHSRAERGAAWLGLMDRFGGDVDWSGHEAAREFLWHRQLHIFLSPFYYVEYGIAQLGALQVWANSRRDPVKALQQYHQGLALGGSRPLPELFAAAGARFAFDTKSIAPLAELLRSELDLQP